MPDPDIQSRLAAWGAQAQPSVPVADRFASRLRRRRVERLAPAILTAASLALTLAASLAIVFTQRPGADIRPWSPNPAQGDLAFDPESLPLTPVRWSKVQSLRAGSCRTPECVESWFEGG